MASICMLPSIKKQQPQNNNCTHILFGFDSTHKYFDKSKQELSLDFQTVLINE